MKKLFIYIVIFSSSFLLNSFQCNNNESTKSLQIEKGNQTKEKYIIGTWFVPHSAFIKITFNKDKTFVFVDFNTKTLKEEILKGKYIIEGNVLTLNYYDRPKQSFTYYKGKAGDTNYYIKKKGYYFVKSD